MNRSTSPTEAITGPQCRELRDSMGKWIISLQESAKADNVSVGKRIDDVNTNFLIFMKEIRDAQAKSDERMDKLNSRLDYTLLLVVCALLGIIGGSAWSVWSPAL